MTLSFSPHKKKCLFLLCVFQSTLLLYSSEVKADWPLWSGGTVTNPVTKDNTGNTVSCNIVIGNQIVPFPFLKRVEVYRLDHTVDSEWQLTFVNTHEYEAKWKETGKGWQTCCRGRLDAKGVSILRDNTGKEMLSISDRFNRHSFSEKEAITNVDVCICVEKIKQV